MIVNIYTHRYIYIHTYVIICVYIYILYTYMLVFPASYVWDWRYERKFYGDLIHRFVCLEQLDSSRQLATASLGCCLYPHCDWNIDSDSGPMWTIYRCCTCEEYGDFTCFIDFYSLPEGKYQLKRSELYNIARCHCNIPSWLLKSTIVPSTLLLFNKGLDNHHF